MKTWPITWNGSNFPPFHGIKRDSITAAIPGPMMNQQLTSRNQNHQVYYHTLGRPQEKDILVFEDREHPDRNFTADVTTDERFLIVYESESTYGNKVYIKNLESKRKEFYPAQRFL